MPAAALAKFDADALQCDSLIADAHRTDASGAFFFQTSSRIQITQAAFLNLFIAWESFLEEAFALFMTGQPTISGRMPVRYVSPPDKNSAKAMIQGNQRYFDYANVDYVRKFAKLFFQDGYPFEPHLGASAVDIADMRTMRNASAHITTTTQTALEALAHRILSIPSPRITVYTLLTTSDPSSPTAETVFGTYRDKLKTAALLIANG